MESLNSERNKIQRKTLIPAFLPLPVPKVITPSQKSTETPKIEEKEKPVVAKKWIAANIFNELKIYSGNVEDVLNKIKNVKEQELIYEVFGKFFSYF